MSGSRLARASAGSLAGWARPRHASGRPGPAAPPPGPPRPYGTAYMSLTRHEEKAVKLYRCRDVEGRMTGGRPRFEQIYMVANNNDPLGATALRLGPTVRTGTKGALFFAYRYMTALDDSIVLKATPPSATRLSPDATTDAFSEVAELDYA